nr:MAG TPA: hypothetical protein [Caudoviricetes sp.]
MVVVSPVDSVVMPAVRVCPPRMRAHLHNKQHRSHSTQQHDPPRFLHFIIFFHGGNMTQAEVDKFRQFEKHIKRFFPDADEWSISDEDALRALGWLNQIYILRVGGGMEYPDIFEQFDEHFCKNIDRSLEYVLTLISDKIEADILSGKTKIITDREVLLTEHPGDSSV